MLSRVWVGWWVGAGSATLFTYGPTSTNPAPPPAKTRTDASAKFGKPSLGDVYSEEDEDWSKEGFALVWKEVKRYLGGVVT